MNSYRLIALIGLGLIARPSLGAKSDCSPSVKVDRSECIDAMAKIVYQDDKTLDHESSLIQTASGNCSISVTYQQEHDVQKQQIEQTVLAILDKCHSGGGRYVIGHSQVYLSVSNADTGPYRPDYTFDQVFCGPDTGTDNLKQADCQKAYDDIHVDNGDHFMTENWNRSMSVTKVHNTCTVQIYSTDHSLLYARKSTLSGTFQKMIRQCNRQPGVVNVQGGVAGLNGHTIVETQISKH